MAKIMYKFTLRSPQEVAAAYGYEENDPAYIGRVKTARADLFRQTAFLSGIELVNTDTDINVLREPNTVKGAVNYIYGITIRSSICSKYEHGCMREIIDRLTYGDDIAELYNLEITLVD